MDTVPIRSLQRHASAVLRRVRRGEQALIADNRVRPAIRDLSELPLPHPAPVPSGRVLDELRGER